MAEEIKITPGFEFKKLVNSQASKLVITNPSGTHIFDTVEEVSGLLYIVVSAEKTAEVSPGRYDYQLQDENGILESGTLTVVRNLALDSSSSEVMMLSLALKQCDEIICGRASSSSNSITIGDKTISYTSLTELIRLRDYLAQRLATAKAAEGEDSISPNDQKVIKFMWRR